MDKASESSPPSDPIDRYIRLFNERSPSPFAIVAAVRDKFGSVTDFKFEYANPAAMKMRDQAELVGQKLLQVFPPSGKNPDLFPRYVRILESQGGDEVEGEFGEAGLEGWFWNLAIALDQDHLGICWRNISTRKDFEQQLMAVSREYRHRLKNAFAVVIALAKQGLRAAASKEELVETLKDRLLSMSVAQNLLIEEGGAASLQHIVTRSLEPFSGRRLLITAGPDVEIGATAVISLCLALNELATNALKFGGLQSGGQTSLTWELDGESVNIVWTERAPRELTAPEREGFGSRLIMDVARRLPAGKINRRFEPTGVVAEISFRVTEQAAVVGAAC